MEGACENEGKRGKDECVNFSFAKQKSSVTEGYGWLCCVTTKALGSCGSLAVTGVQKLFNPRVARSCAIIWQKTAQLWPFWVGSWKPNFTSLATWDAVVNWFLVNWTERQIHKAVWPGLPTPPKKTAKIPPKKNPRGAIFFAAAYSSDWHKAPSSLKCSGC